MSKNDSNEILEFLKNKKHATWILFPLVQDYTVETTLAVFYLCPSSYSYKVPNDIREILKARGYTRLYVLYLFSRIGEFIKTYNKPIEKSIDKGHDEAINRIIPDVGKIFFAYGEPENKKLMKHVSKRAAEVRRKILTIKPNINFYHFGKLSEFGFPKALEGLGVDDSENQF